MSLFFAAVRAASGPAPNGTPYVAGAYLFFLLVIVIYVGISIFMFWEGIATLRAGRGRKARLQRDDTGREQGRRCHHLPGELVHHREARAPEPRREGSR